MDTFATYNKKLSGYKDVSETVKILEKIAAGKLHTLEHRSVILSEYTKNILLTLARVQQLSESFPENTPIKKKIKKSLLIILTGDKGLVGGLWNRLFNYYKKDAQQDILVFGKKGQSEWAESIPQVKHYSFTERLPTADEIQTLELILSNYIHDGTYGCISTLHVEPLSLTEQNPVQTQLLPIDIASLDFTYGNIGSFGYPIISGSLEQFKKTLLQKYITSRLQQIILETAVSEYSARAVAMEHASTKTDESSKQLAKGYTRDKRQVETQKQLERFSSNHCTI